MVALSQPTGVPGGLEGRRSGARGPEVGESSGNHTNERGPMDATEHPPDKTPADVAREFAALVIATHQGGLAPEKMLWTAVLTGHVPWVIEAAALEWYAYAVAFASTPPQRAAISVRQRLERRRDQHFSALLEWAQHQRVTS
jgi:hypothetical protein